MAKQEEPVDEHRPPEGACLKPQGVRIMLYPTSHAGREWWLTDDLGAAAVRVRYCPFCGAAL